MPPTSTDPDLSTILARIESRLDGLTTAPGEIPNLTKVKISKMPERYNKMGVCNLNTLLPRRWDRGESTEWSHSMVSDSWRLLNVTAIITFIRQIIKLKNIG